MRYLGKHRNDYQGIDTIKWSSDYDATVVRLVCTEFTSICPVTSQPDFGTITVCYLPRDLLIETKSLKLYLQTWRSQSSFVEVVTRDICSHLYRAISPQWIVVLAEFNPRGGICPKALQCIGIDPDKVRWLI